MFIKCYYGRNNVLSEKTGIINTEQIIRVYLDIDKNDQYIISPIEKNGKKYYLLETAHTYNTYNEYLSEDEVRFLLNQGSGKQG